MGAGPDRRRRVGDQEVEGRGECCGRFDEIRASERFGIKLHVLFLQLVIWKIFFKNR